LNDIWEAAPKFPDVETAKVRIDVDSFVRIYRDVDDLFENEEEKEGTAGVTETKDYGSAVEDEEEGDYEEDSLEAELQTIYSSICNKNGRVSKDDIKAWDEVQQLLDQGLLGVDEFDDIWQKTPKSPGSGDQLDVDGFLSLNVALDGLFQFDDDDVDFEGIEEVDDKEDDTPLSVAVPKAAKKKEIVVGDDLPPGILFAALADEDYLVGMEELKSWGGLQEMLADGDLLPLELKNMFDAVEKAPGKDDKLTEDGFLKLYEDIDVLFENDDEEKPKAPPAAPPTQTYRNLVKKDLLGFLESIGYGEDSLPCGLDSTEAEQKQVLNIVTALEDQPTNMIRLKNANIEMVDLVGKWDLMYSSSSAMKFNQGLSGIGGSFPSGKFGGLTQKLETSKYMSDVEYIERIEVNPSSASFDVKVTGDWDLRTSVSLFTGLPSIILNIEPGRVEYGPTSTRGDHWKSLGPLNMLDLTYLDEDFRVMRGATAADVVFLFKRCL
jgi:hypothetical protein